MTDSAETVRERERERPTSIEMAFGVAAEIALEFSETDGDTAEQIYAAIHKHRAALSPAPSGEWEIVRLPHFREVISAAQDRWVAGENRDLQEAFIEGASFVANAAEPIRPAPSGEREKLADACEPWKNCTGGPPDWNSPLQNVWQAAICWTLDLVGKVLGAKDWERGDGSETLEGDVSAEVHHIMRAAGLTNQDGDTITKEELAALRQPVPVKGLSEEVVELLKGADLEGCTCKACCCIRAVLTRLAPVSQDKEGK